MKNDATILVGIGRKNFPKLNVKKNKNGNANVGFSILLEYLLNFSLLFAYNNA